MNNINIEAEFTLNEQPDIQADFSIKLTPQKVSQLENDLNFQTQEQVNEAIQAESDIINARIDDIEQSSITEIIGAGNINAVQNENTVTITSTTYTHEQGMASDTWVIEHNLNKHPSFFAVDSAGFVQIPDDIEYVNENKIIAYFVSAFTGKAYLN